MQNFRSENAELIWKAFALTGQVGLYLLYNELQNGKDLELSNEEELEF